jgi:uncharacterized membrane protein HdeD (DUF308 family)
MLDMGFTALGAITVMVFLIVQILKATSLDNKWLPVICGVLGGILGVVARLTMPQFPADDWFDTIAIGIVSGLAATGAHQTYRQLTVNK